MDTPSYLSEISNEEFDEDSSFDGFLQNKITIKRNEILELKKKEEKEKEKEKEIVVDNSKGKEELNAHANNDNSNDIEVADVVIDFNNKEQDDVEPINFKREIMSSNLLNLKIQEHQADVTDSFWQGSCYCIASVCMCLFLGLLIPLYKLN